MKKLGSLLLAAACALALATPAGAAPPDPNGRAGAMPAYYDDALFTINFFELPADAAASLLAHNKNLNVIYMSESPLPNDEEFVAVLDAIQGDGFNPLWVEADVVFNAGFTPRQLTSDTDIDAAVAAGEIHVEMTAEVYRCSVIGPRGGAHDDMSLIRHAPLRPLSDPAPAGARLSWSALKGDFARR